MGLTNLTWGFQPQLWAQRFHFSSSWDHQPLLELRWNSVDQPQPFPHGGPLSRPQSTDWLPGLILLWCRHEGPVLNKSLILIYWVTSGFDLGRVLSSWYVIMTRFLTKPGNFLQICLVLSLCTMRWVLADGYLFYQPPCMWPSASGGLKGQFALLFLNNWF